MSVLVVVDHDGRKLKPGVANTVTAATKMGGEIVALVAGQQCAEAARRCLRQANLEKDPVWRKRFLQHAKNHQALARLANLLAKKSQPKT